MTGNMFFKSKRQKKYNAGNGFAPTGSVMLLSLASILFSLILPLSLSEHEAALPLASLTCILCGVIMIITSRRFLPVIILALLFTFSNLYLGSPVLAAIAAGVMISCGIISASAAASRSFAVLLPVSAPLISFCAAMYMTRDIYTSALALVALPPALAMGLSARKKATRTFQIAAFALTALIELAVGALLHIHTQNGKITLEAIAGSAEYLKSFIEDALQERIMLVNPDSLTEDIVIMTRAAASETVNLLVGICAACAISAGFIVQRIQASLFGSFETDELKTESEAPIKASLTAALIFTAAHILSYTSGASYAPSFLASAAANISLILLPLLLYIGFGAIASLPKRIGLLAIAVWIGIALLSTLLSSSIIDILALAGAFYIIFVNTDSWAKEHYGKGEDQ